MRNIARGFLSAVILSMVITVLLFTIGAPAFAQTTAHQRVGVEAKDSFEATIGTSVEIFRFDTTKTNAVEIDPAISLDLFFRRRFGLSFEVPALVWIAMGREAVPRSVGAVGDPEVAASYTFRISDWRLSAALSYSYPLDMEFLRGYRKTDRLRIGVLQARSFILRSPLPRPDRRGNEPKRRDLLREAGTRGHIDEAAHPHRELLCHGSAE